MESNNPDPSFSSDFIVSNITKRNIAPADSRPRHLEKRAVVARPVDVCPTNRTPLEYTKFGGSRCIRDYDASTLAITCVQPFGFLMYDTADETEHLCAYHGICIDEPGATPPKAWCADGRSFWYPVEAGAANEMQTVTVSNREHQLGGRTILVVLTEGAYQVPDRLVKVPRISLVPRGMNHDTLARASVCDGCSSIDFQSMPAETAYLEMTIFMRANIEVIVSGYIWQF